MSVRRKMSLETYSILFRSNGLIMGLSILRRSRQWSLTACLFKINGALGARRAQFRRRAHDFRHCAPDVCTFFKPAIIQIYSRVHQEIKVSMCAPLGRTGPQAVRPRGAQIKTLISNTVGLTLSTWFLVNFSKMSLQWVYSVLTTMQRVILDRQLSSIRPTAPYLLMSS